MGLDMYLQKRKQVKNWEFTKPNERYEITVKCGGKRVPKSKVDPEAISELVFDAGYWRKANAIHRWFVENVQDGEDDCREYYVSHERLQELLDRVNAVLASAKLVDGEVAASYSLGEEGKWLPNMEPGKVMDNTAVAKELLPTQEGFFFGGTDYDEWYYENLKQTKDILEGALKDTGAYYYYSSSW